MISLETTLPVAGNDEACAAIDREASSAPKRVLLFTIPASDAREFASELPHTVQMETRFLLAKLAQIHASKNKSATCRQIATVMQAQGKRGYSVGSLWRKYDAYRKTGDWREVVDGAKAPAQKIGLPKEFIPFFQRLCENNQRACSMGILELRTIWQTRHDSAGKMYKSIPGYAAWPQADPRTGFPAGWTERNLYRYVPEDFALALARQGRAAASEHRLKVYKTRVGLRVGEFYQFDDHEYNVKVNFPGQWKAMRPRGFTAIDVLSSFAFAKSFKPTLWDEAEEKKQALTEKDMMWFVIHVLCDFGYRTDDLGTAFCVEHGTAAIRGDFETRILDATGGRVRIERSGKFGTEGGGRLQVASQFKGQAKGNFRFKALIESFWNIIDNHLAGVPGQVGKDRLAAPEQMHGMDAYNNKLLKVAQSLPVAQATSLKFPVLTWPEFLDAALRCYQVIGETSEHELQGWEKCGFVKKEWRLRDTHPWMPFEELLELGDAEQAVARGLMLRNPLLHRARQLSRVEAFSAGRRELTQLPAYMMPSLIGVENALRKGEAIAARSGVFEFNLDELDSDTLRFVAVDAHGQKLTDKYVCFVNPFNPAVLVACDSKLRVVAECRPVVQGCYNDVETTKQALGAARSWEAAEVNEFNARHAEDIRRLADMHEHNARVMQGAKPAERPAPAVVEDCTEELLKREGQNLKPEEPMY